MKSNRIFGFRSLEPKNLDHIKKNITSLLKKNKLYCLDEYSGEDYLILLISKNKDKEIKQNSKIIVSIDGYITNIESIKEEYGIKTKYDNIVIEELLHKGVKNIEKLLIGSYSISALDTDTKELTLIRDYIGSKPLFYTQNNNFLAFGSEIKFLKCIDWLEIKPNHRRIVQYLCQHKEFKSDTFYENIYSIEPGYKYTFSCDGHEKKAYEHIEDYSSKAKNFEEAKQELISRLTLSIKDSQRIFGEESTVLLSGGLDSACIYEIFKCNLKQSEIKTISKNFYSENGEKLNCDESFYQNKIHKNSKSHIEIRMQHQSPFHNVEHWLERYDEPFNLANAYLWEEIMKTAKRDNIALLYDGIDGDAVVSHGWQRFKETFNFFQLPIFIYEMAKFSKLHDYTDTVKTPLHRIFTKPLLKGSFFLKPLFFIKNLFQKKKTNKKNIINTKYRLKYKIEDSYDFSKNYKSHQEQIKNSLADVGFTNLNILFFEYDIQQISPFFDKRVVDLCVSFPTSYKLRHGRSRYILREAFKDLLPMEIYNRFTKANLTENFSLKITNEDIENIQASLNELHPLIQKIVDQNYLNEELEKFTQKTLKEKTNMTIWGIYLVNTWLKKNFNSK